MATTLPTLDVATLRAEAEALNSTGQNTFLVTANSLLDRPIEGDDDYEACVALGNEAARRESVMEKKFSPLCDLLHKSWKAAVALRQEFTAPWAELKDNLRKKAARWYLDQQKAKADAERELGRLAAQQQRELAAKAQDLIDMGFVKQGREQLLMAEATVAPILPAATPTVEGARVTPKFKATVTDLMAVYRAIVNGDVDLSWEVRGEMRPLAPVDQVVLNAIVNRQGKGFKCPGILVEDDVRIGAKRL